MFWRRVLASESEGDEAARDGGHREHFRLLGEEGRSWSGREPDVLFDNRGGTFAEVGSLLGLHSRLDGRGAAAADLDDDGDLDLVVVSRNSPTVRVYRNDVASQGHVLLVDLKDGAGGPAVGAEIEAQCGDRTFVRLVSAGSGFLSQAPSRVHFGLGDCAAIDELRVRRGDRVQRVGPARAGDSLVLAANRRIVVDGDRVVSSHPLEAASRPDGLVPAAAEGLVSIPAPSVTLEGLGGAPAPDFGALAQGTVVLNFWATWCTGCAAEHDDLLAVSADPRHGAVSFVAITRDDPASGQPDAAAVAAWGDRWLVAAGGPDVQSPFTAAAGLPSEAVPLTVVIHEGVVRWAHAGAVSKERLDRVLAAIR